MKHPILILLLCLTGYLLPAQEVVVQGQLSSIASEFQPASNSSVFFKYLNESEEEVIAAIPVNSVGRFQHQFPAETDVQFYIYYKSFFPIDTLINTGSDAILNLAFELTTKSLRFTAESASKDIEANAVRIIFHDMEMHSLFKKANFKEKYGFHFEYLERPESWEELRDISEYNSVMETYLDNINGAGWRDKLYAEMDSLIEIRESYAGLEPANEVSEAEELAVVLPETTPTEEVEETLPPVESIDTESAPKAIEIASNPVSTEPVYMVQLPKEGIELMPFDEESDPLVLEPADHILNPPITTSADPMLYIPIESLPEPVAVAIEPPVTEEVVEEVLETETLSGPLASETPVVEATLPAEEAEVVALPVANEEKPQETGMAAAEIEEVLPVVKVEVQEEIVEPTLQEETVQEEAMPIAAATPKSIETITKPAAPAPIVPKSVVIETKNEKNETGKTAIVEFYPEGLPPEILAIREAREEKRNVSAPQSSIVGHLEQRQEAALNIALAAAESMYGSEKVASRPASWTFPQNAHLSPEMQSTIEDHQSIYDHHYSSKNPHNTDAPVAFMLHLIDQDTNYNNLEIIQFWAAHHYETLIPELIFRLTSDKEVGLGNTDEIIIWDRVESGDQEIGGPAAEVADDLFTVAGRANYLLKILTGEDFGPVTMHGTEKDKLKLRDNWVNWLMNLDSGNAWVSP